MKHLLVKATVTAVEQGQFSAIAAAYSRDRQNEIVVPGAFSETIAAWKTIQKDIPLQSLGRLTPRRWPNARTASM